MLTLPRREIILSPILHVYRQKDDVAGELPVAFVVRSNGFELTEETVKEFVAKQVGRNFLPSPPYSNQSLP